MNPHKKEESSFCLCVWLPVSGVLTPQVLIFPSGWQLADSVSRYQKKRGPIMLGGQQNTMGLLEQSVEDQLGEVWLQYD